jgi:AcrR family transcriptional regulator
MLAMPTSTRLRADAARNRDRLIATARAVFAERGLDAPLDEIAKRAGVGSGTLYRHFPTRDDLITAVFLEQTAENLAALERAQQHEDPWEAFADYVRQTCRAQAADRGMADLLAIGHRSRELRALRTHAYNGFIALIDRAKASGTLRADFSPEDLVLLLMATAGIISRTGATAPAATDRFVALALDGFRAKAATPAPPPISSRTMILRLREIARAS